MWVHNLVLAMLWLLVQQRKWSLASSVVWNICSQGFMFPWFLVSWKRVHTVHCCSAPVHCCSAAYIYFDNLVGNPTITLPICKVLIIFTWCQYDFDNWPRNSVSNDIGFILSFAWYIVLKPLLVVIQQPHILQAYCWLDAKTSITDVASTVMNKSCYDSHIWGFW